MQKVTSHSLPSHGYASQLFVTVNKIKGEGIKLHIVLNLKGSIYLFKINILVIGLLLMLAPEKLSIVWVNNPDDTMTSGLALRLEMFKKLKTKENTHLWIWENLTNDTLYLHHRKCGIVCFSSLTQKQRTKSEDFLASAALKLPFLTATFVSSPTLNVK